MSINLPRAVLINNISIPGTFWVLVWSSEAKFVLYRGIANNLKKIVEGEEVIAFIWELTELVERGHISG